MARMVSFQTQWVLEDLNSIIEEAARETPNMYVIRDRARAVRTRLTGVLAQDIEIEPAPVRVAGGAQS